MSWCTSVADDCVRILVKTQPNAKVTEIVGLQNDALKIRVAAPAVEGAANEELLSFLAKNLGLKLRDVTLVRGAISRQKLIEIRGINKTEALLRLLPTKD